jgi:chemotaxis protein methyltransferase CheR
MGKRWPGYRRVRRQVCKRIGRRLKELGLSGPSAYGSHLATHREEWVRLESFCRITISRFYRDRQVFSVLGSGVLPALARRAAGRADPRLRCWSAGCASGEEPYTLKMLWELETGSAFEGVTLSIIATDAEPKVLDRAREARFPAGSLRDLPDGWRDAAFDRSNGDYRLRRAFREGIEFRLQDIGEGMPEGVFDLVLCRNLVFTYEDERSQRRSLRRLVERVRPGGVLVIGVHEVLPEPGTLVADTDAPGIYRKPEPF